MVELTCIADILVCNSKVIICKLLELCACVCVSFFVWGVVLRGVRIQNTH